MLRQILGGCDSILEGTVEFARSPAVQANDPEEVCTVPCAF